MKSNSLWLPEQAYESEPLLSIQELDSELSSFERLYPEVTAKNAGDQVIDRYTKLAEQAASRLVMMSREAASMIYQSHVPLFTDMEDFLLLAAVACLHFSTEKARLKKVQVMADLNEWSGKMAVDHPLMERWKALYSAGKTEKLIELWRSLAGLYQDFLLNPDWG